MQTNVFIFHGTEGYPEENWFPWMKGELEKADCKVIVPQFPSPPVVPAKITEWFEVLKKHRQNIDEHTVFIGHSLGGVFTLRVLETLEKPVRAAFFVGAPIGVKPILNYDRDQAFSGFSFDWKVIRQKARYFAVFQSDDDPYVGLDNGKQLAANLGIELNFIPNAGHFNTKAGYGTFDALRNEVLKVIGRE